jgi:hypothetical protein
VDKNFLPLTLSLLESLDHWIRDLTFWIIANVAVDNWEYRNKLIDLGAVQRVLSALPHEQSAYEHLDGIQALASLIQGKPDVVYSKVAATTPVLCAPINARDETSCLKDSLRGI